MIEPRTVQTRVPVHTSEQSPESQTWRMACVVVGVPGAMVTAVMTTGFVMSSARGNPLWDAAVWATVVTVYAGTMIVLWLAAAAEAARR